MSRKRIAVLLWMGLLLAMTPSVSAQGIVNAAVNGNEVTAQIQLPGNISAELVLSFEDAEGLDLNSLGLSACLVNPNDPFLINRLMGGGLLSVPAAFPALLTIAPPANGPLSFRGLYCLSLHTNNLDYSAAVPLRLFKAPAGGVFQDITESAGPGSYRVAGTGGSFSDFLIVLDSRAQNSIIASKFDALQAGLESNAGAITPAVLATLRNLLAEARAAYASGAIQDTLSKIEAFSQTVKEYSGNDIPEQWLANGTLVNVAGLLRAGGDTLKFSLSLNL